MPQCKASAWGWKPLEPSCWGQRLSCCHLVSCCVDDLTGAALIPASPEAWAPYPLYTTELTPAIPHAAFTYPAAAAAAAALHAQVSRSLRQNPAPFCPALALAPAGSAWLVRPWPLHLGSQAEPPPCVEAPQLGANRRGWVCVEQSSQGWMMTSDLEVQPASRQEAGRWESRGSVSGWLLWSLQPEAGTTGRKNYLPASKMSSLKSWQRQQA